MENSQGFTRHAIGPAFVSRTVFSLQCLVSASRLSSGTLIPDRKKSPFLRKAVSTDWLPGSALPLVWKQNQLCFFPIRSFGKELVTPDEEVLTPRLVVSVSCQ